MHARSTTQRLNNALSVPLLCLYSAFTVLMSKVEFLRNFNVTDKVDDDVILITDEEEFCDHKISFEHGKINRIVLRMGAD